MLWVMFRVISFDVTWTFLDKYSIPKINNDYLSKEVSMSIVMLGYTPHLLVNLKGTLAFFVCAFILIVLPWPRTTAK